MMDTGCTVHGLFNQLLKEALAYFFKDLKTFLDLSSMSRYEASIPSDTIPITQDGDIALVFSVL